MEECNICFSKNYIIKKCCTLNYCYNCYSRFNSFCCICENNELNIKKICGKCKSKKKTINLYKCIICYNYYCGNCILIKKYHSNLCVNNICIIINNNRNNKY